MTNELTDAVRRLKELQSDVERLKAARDKGGVPRLFFETDEGAVAVDTLDLRAAGVSALEQAVVADTLDLKAADLSTVERATATETQAGLVASDISTADTATATDAQADLRLQRTVEAATYNRSGYNTSTYS